MLARLHVVNFIALPDVQKFQNKNLLFHISKAILQNTLTNFKEIELKLQSRYSFQQFCFTCTIEGTNTFKNCPPTEMHN